MILFSDISAFSGVARLLSKQRCGAKSGRGYRSRGRFVLGRHDPLENNRPSPLSNHFFILLLIFPPDQFKMEEINPKMEELKPEWAVPESLTGTPLSVRQPRRKYPAITTMAMKGVHKVHIFRFPVKDSNDIETEVCYSFQFKRNTNGGKDYMCINCKALKHTVRVKVKDGYFLEDPSALEHRCQPRPWIEESAKRTLYKTLRSLRNSPHMNLTPKHVYTCMLDDIEENPDIGEREKFYLKEALGPYDGHRRALSRAVNANKNKTVAAKTDDVEEAEIEDNQDVEQKDKWIRKLLRKNIACNFRGVGANSPDDDEMEDWDKTTESLFADDTVVKTEENRDCGQTSKVGTNYEDHEGTKAEDLMDLDSIVVKEEEPESIEGYGVTMQQKKCDTAVQTDESIEPFKNVAARNPTKEQILEYLDQIRLFVVQNM